MGELHLSPSTLLPVAEDGFKKELFKGKLSAAAVALLRKTKAMTEVRKRSIP